MSQNFKNGLSDVFELLKGKRLLLAVSGGIDSMVMVDLFHSNQFDIALAHCNFQLRERESDADEDFVDGFAKNNSIPLFVMRFDTVKFASDFKLSTQMAARELRYRWFYELAEKEHFDWILTAHHADDNLETFLVNFSRGTGIEGLTGIPKQNDKIFRPLLAFSRDQIEAYAKSHRITWREDSSNSSDKYLRNKIRHDLVPILKELNPEMLATFQKTQDYLQQTRAMAEDAAILVYQQVAQQANEEIHFNLDKLKRLPNYASYLYHWLHGFGFTAWDDIYDLVRSQSGKQVFAPEYRLVKSRQFLILSPLPGKDDALIFEIAAGQHEVNFPIKLSFSEADAVSNVSNNSIFVDAQKIQFPLVLRKWNEGDAFQPFGMNGQSKKVSKFFKDQHFTITQKEDAWLLCSGTDIVWIVGHRADERFKVQPTTNQILKITATQ